MKLYNNTYTDFRHETSESFRISATEIISILMNYIKPESVVDVGCGTGIWLSVFKNNYNIHDILGINGDWVDKRTLIIDSKDFLTHNLLYPLEIDRKFDLVISLEVAEHLPADSSDIFIDSLTKLGNVILFSAAIPFQGGNRHVNEQWLDYWIDKFNERGYVVLDFIREKIWENEKVKWWLAQNILLFVKKEALNNFSSLKAIYEKGNTLPLHLVHPKNYLDKADLKKLGIKKLVKRILRQYFLKPGN